MDSTESPPITTAGPPFNDASDFADLVIRTSDNVDFFVHRAFLLLKSPSSFFRHALYGSHHTEEKGGLPVLEVVEDSATFKFILLFCYPYDTPELASVSQFSATMIASPLIKEQPLRVFAVAVANGWKMLGETAARNTLGVPLDGVESDVKELDDISARHLQRLLKYHKQFKKTMLVDPRPQVAFDDGIIRRAILASIKECNNDSWIRDASSQVHELAQLVAAEIEKRISEVPLEIEWTK
ncbi:hypothetical protein F5146DRAFT_1144319 [Armillaria mellea]|nr:hypothetical protein F5146DRAFT_1144319 [Armillaria mellea]